MGEGSSSKVKEKEKGVDQNIALLLSIRGTCLMITVPYDIVPRNISLYLP